MSRSQAAKTLLRGASAIPAVPGTPDAVAANPVIGTGGPRNIQLGLRFRF